MWVQRVQTEYPNFWDTRKFVEGCRQALRTKALASLGVSPVHSTFARIKRLDHDVQMIVRKSRFLSFRRESRLLQTNKPISLRPLPLWEPAKWNKVQSCRFSLWQWIWGILQLQRQSAEAYLVSQARNKSAGSIFHNALWFSTSHEIRLVGSSETIFVD